jgi:hypothetical protein
MEVWKSYYVSLQEVNSNILSRTQTNLLFEYSDADYESINKALAEGGKDPGFRESIRILSENGFTLFDGQRRRLYRGDKVPDAYLENERINFKKPLSTTAFKEVAEGFALDTSSASQKTPTLVMAMVNPKTMNAAVIAPFSANADECEVLVAPDTSWDVLLHAEVNGNDGEVRHLVVIEEVGAPKPDQTKRLHTDLVVPSSVVEKPIVQPKQPGDKQSLAEFIADKYQRAFEGENQKPIQRGRDEVAQFLAEESPDLLAEYAEEFGLTVEGKNAAANQWIRRQPIRNERL